VKIHIGHSETLST